MTKETTRQQNKEYAHLSRLYQLAFLLTGCPERGASIVIEAFAADEPCSLGCRSTRNQIRKAIIERALCEVAAEPPVPGPVISDVCTAPVIRGTTIGWNELEAALLRLNLFSRRTLLLTVFEGYSLQEAALLLACDTAVVEDVRADALRSLTNSL